MEICKSKNGKNIILDLDSTLIHTFDNKELREIQEYDILNDPRYLDIRKDLYSIDIGTRGTNPNIFGIKRPYSTLFLNYIFENFQIVAVWSAGVFKYVHGVTADLFKNSCSPHVIMTRNDCTGPIHSLEKPIFKMIKEVPGLNTYMNLSNTIIVDDRDCSIRPNYHNGVLIPPFEPDPYPEAFRSKDMALLQLIDWFESPEFKNSDDVTKLDKNYIFKSNNIKFNNYEDYSHCKCKFN